MFEVVLPKLYRTRREILAQPCSSLPKIISNHQNQGVHLAYADDLSGYNFLTMLTIGFARGLEADYYNYVTLCINRDPAVRVRRNLAAIRVHPDGRTFTDILSSR
jgi:hypothetical protein